MDTLLSIQNLSKNYGQTKALDDVSLSLNGGQIVGLLGPNGSGKTTMIKIINTLISDYKGTVLVCGNKPGKESKGDISYLPDISMLNAWMKIETAIDTYNDFYSDFDRQKAEEMLQIVGLNKKQTIKTLSKGMNEKLQLVLVMARKAKLYIFDEPIAGVDPAARDFILKTILTNYSQEASIFFSTHLISDIEAIMDRAIFLKNGKIVLDDEVENIREKHQMSIDQLFREEFKC